MSAENYFVAGRAGFIGGNVVTFLQKKGQDIQGIRYNRLKYEGNLLNLTPAEKDVTIPLCGI